MSSFVGLVAVFVFSQDPKKWLRAAFAKRVALSKWSDMAFQGSLLSSPLDLKDLFRPETFLNALRQQAAREARVSMDTLKLVSCFDPRLLNRAPLPVTLDGLMLQGAVYESNQLGEANGDTPELVPLPPACIAFVPAADPEPYPGDSAFDSPVYFGLDREKLLMQLSLPTRAGATPWVLAGAAVFLSGE